MDTLSAFMMGEINRGKKMKVFDWDEAARRIKASGTDVASAGLSDDWGSTGGIIFRNGQPLNKDETYTYLASTWATPELNIEDLWASYGNSCYITEDEAYIRWGNNTPQEQFNFAGIFWPDSALKILKGE